MLAQAILETKVEVDGPAFRDAALHFSSQSNRRVPDMPDSTADRLCNMVYGCALHVSKGLI